MTGGAPSQRLAQPPRESVAAGTARWRMLADHRSPYQSPEWYEATGWMGRTELLGDTDAALAVWSARPGAEHHFHDPVALLTGTPEREFLAGLEGLVAEVRAAVNRPSPVTISPYGYRGGAICRPGADRYALRRLAEAFVDTARGRGAQLALSHYLYAEDDRRWLDVLVEAGALPLVLGADAVVDVSWSSLSEYYRWLGRSRRSQRKEARALGVLGPDWSAHVGPGVPDGFHHVPDLLRADAARRGGTGPPAMLYHALVAGESMDRVILGRHAGDGRVRSAVVALRRAGVLYPKAFGTAGNRRDYFPLAYPAVLHHAIDSGIHRVEYGGGAHHSKLLRGARLRLGYAALLVLDPALRDSVLPLAEEISRRKERYFTELAGRWEHRPAEASRETS
jgi:hypothetical protein